MEIRKIVAGATVAGVIALGAGGVAVASSSGVGSMAPEQTGVEQGMAAGQPTAGPEGGPGHGPGGKDAEKIAELEQLVQYARISREQADEVALGQASGQIIENKLDEKHGYAVYEVEVLGDGTLTEFYINAENGEILETEVKGGEDGSDMESLPEGPLADQDDDDYDERGPQGGPGNGGPEAPHGGPESGSLPNTGGEEQD